MSDRPSFSRRLAPRQRARLSWMVALLLLTGGALLGRELLGEPEVGALVQVRGEVERPGWYETAELAEALALAGAEVEAADATLTDGTVVLVSGGEVSLRPPSEPLVFGLPLDLNEAPAEALEAIPGVGPAKAAAIVAGRPYAELDELLAVPGVGRATLEAIRPFVRVGR